MVQRVEVEVRQQRTDDGSLRGAALRRLPAFQFFQHPGFEALFQQPQDAAVHDALPNQLHQPWVRDRVEVTLEVTVHAVLVALVQ